jgi:hypothetical protein
VLLVGSKLNAPRRLLQVTQRRKELKTALAILQRGLWKEDLAAWLDDVLHDTANREGRVAEIESPSGRVFNALENEAIARGETMFAVFDGCSGGATPLTHATTIKRSETKLDKATGLLLGRAEVLIRARPHDIATYLLNYDSRHIHSSDNPAVDVRCEVLQHVNAHHTVIYNRRTVTGMTDRTFLNAIVAKKLEDDPQTYLVSTVPIPAHDKIGPKDEAKAVRAENRRSFRMTEVTPGRTNVDYTCSLNLRGSIPQAITNKFAVPAQQHGAHLICMAHTAPSSARCD